MRWRQVGSVLMKAWVNKKVLSLDLKTHRVRESLVRTGCGSKFGRDAGAENQKARLEKCVLVNGLTSSGMAYKHRVRLRTRYVCGCLYRELFPAL